MKWLFCALLLINVTVLLLPVGQSRNFGALSAAFGDRAGFGGDQDRDPAINPKDLILLSEKIGFDKSADAGTVATSAPNSAIEVEGGGNATDTGATSVASSASLGTGSDQRHCLRIGPFFDDAEKTAARDFVASFEVPVETQIVAGRIVRSWRAFIGPFSEDEEMSAVEDRAKAAGFTNSRRLSPEENVVSLGLFSTRKSAERIQALSRGANLAVEIREERTQLRATNWLEVAGPGVTIYELRMIDRTDWREDQVNVREITCSQ